jgi:hypothetical protein
MADARHVDPARGDVSRDQHRDGPERKAASAAVRCGWLLLPWIAAALTPAARWRTTRSAPCLVRVNTSARSIDFSARPSRRTRTHGQQRLLFGWLTKVTNWSTRSAVVACGATSTRTGFWMNWLAQFGDRLGHGRREEQALALLGQHRGNALQRHDEAEVHHLVGFVEHEDLDIAQRQRALVDQVEQAARRGDEHVAAANQRAALLADGMPPNTHWTERFRYLA